MMNAKSQSGRIATARVQPAEARWIFTGKQTTSKPSAGNCSRLCSFSRCVIANLAAGAVAFPDQPGIAGLCHPCVACARTAHPNSSRRCRPGARRAQASTKSRPCPCRSLTQHVVVITVFRTRRGVHHDDLQWLQGVADTLQFGFHIGRCRDIAVGEMAEVEFNRWLEAPFQRHLVDPPRRFAASFEFMVHRRKIGFLAVSRG